MLARVNAICEWGCAAYIHYGNTSIIIYLVVYTVPPLPEGSTGIYPGYVISLYMYGKAYRTVQRHREAPDSTVLCSLCDSTRTTRNTL